MNLPGPDLDDLHMAATRLVAGLETYSGIHNTMHDLLPGRPELRLTLAEGATGLGLTGRDVAGQIGAALLGQIITELNNAVLLVQAMDNHKSRGVAQAQAVGPASRDRFRPDARQRAEPPLFLFGYLARLIGVELDSVPSDKNRWIILRVWGFCFCCPDPKFRGILSVRGIVPSAKGIEMANYLYKNDLPADLELGPVVAIDCETMGLNPHRDRLCVIQMSGGDGNAHLVQIEKGQHEAPNLAAMLENPDVLKLFHFGRFDIAAMYNAFGALAAPVYCTKIASKLVRTYTDRHGLKNLLQELIGVDISKQQQSSDWGAPDLTDAQLDYAASDVLYLHRLRDELNRMLAREGRVEVAQACFDFLPTRARLDLAGWPEIDIFAH